MDKRRSIPPPSEGGPGRIPRGHAEEPTGALEPRRRKPRTDTPGGHHREHPTAPAEGGVRDARTPASGTGRAVEDHRHCWHCYADARCRQPAWDISTDARYIPLAVSTTPSQCRQPPRGADNARPHSHHCGSTAAVEAPVLRVAHTRTPIYETCAAHKGLIPPLCAALCCLIPSLVCDMGRGRPTRAAVPVRSVRGGERCRR